MHEDPRKAPLPNDPAAHSDAVGRPVDASSRIAFTTSDGQPVEVPLLTLVPTAVGPYAGIPPLSG